MLIKNFGIPGNIIWGGGGVAHAPRAPPQVPTPMFSNDSDHLHNTMS